MQRLLSSEGGADGLRERRRVSPRPVERRSLANRGVRPSSSAQTSEHKCDAAGSEPAPGATGNLAPDRVVRHAPDILRQVPLAELADSPPSHFQNQQPEAPISVLKSRQLARQPASRRRLFAQRHCGLQADLPDEAQPLSRGRLRDRVRACREAWMCSTARFGKDDALLYPAAGIKNCDWR